MRCCPERKHCLPHHGNLAADVMAGAAEKGGVDDFVARRAEFHDEGVAVVVFARAFESGLEGAGVTGNLGLVVLPAM